MRLPDSVLTAIGNTPLVRLRRVVPPDCAEVVVKLEGVNPTGSMKDRMAQAMIARAEESGRLRPGDTVVEYTGGSTGASLALVCAAKGYRLRIVSSDAFSEDKLAQMAAFGAELTLVPSEGGRITNELIRAMIATAQEMASSPRTYWTDQLNNADSITGYHPMGEEIWRQTDGRVDAFVQSVGTAASLRGVSAVLRRHKPSITIVAVEPAESAVLSGGPPGAHRIEGIGIGYRPPLWDPSIVDDIVAVPTEQAQAMARRLAREEGLFTGTSSGANVVAAIEVGRRLGPFTGADRIALLGHSWGAMIVARYVSDHPERVAAVVFSAPGALPDAGGHVVPGDPTVRLSAGGRARLYARLAWPRNLFAYALTAVDPEAAHAVASDAEMDRRFAAVYGDTTPALFCDPDLTDRLGTSGVGYYAHQMPQLHPDHPVIDRSRLASVTAPVLVIKPACDYLPWRTAAEYLDVFPTARMVLLPDTGHQAYLERPDAYTQLVGDFLAGRALPLPVQNGQHIPPDYRGTR